MIRFYQRTDCPFCWKVRLAMHEYAIKYQSVETVLGDKHPDVLRYNPKGSVPVLVDGEVVVWESAVALEYLNECYADHSLFSNNTAQRASIRLLQSYSDSIVGPTLRDMVFEKRSRPESEWDRGKIDQSDKAWRNCLDQLEDWLSGQEFFVEGFSAAECALLPRFGVAEVYGASVDQRHPELHQWFSQLKQRPSYGAAYPKSFIGIPDQRG